MDLRLSLRFAQPVRAVSEPSFGQVAPSSVFGDDLVRWDTLRADPMPEIDIWFSARLLIDCHGQQARLEAARRLADFQLSGDHEAARDWARVHQAILVLMELPQQGTVRH